MEPMIKETILTKNDQSAIFIEGFDNCNQLGEKYNKYNENKDPIIDPPLKLPFDSSMSYSIYSCHSVQIKNNGSITGVGNNTDGRINSYEEFSITDLEGNKLVPISAVCCSFSTLYMCLKNNSKKRQLIFCDNSINDGEAVFLNIGNQQPMALFGGSLHAAAIKKHLLIYLFKNIIQIPCKISHLLKKKIDYLIE